MDEILNPAHGISWSAILFVAGGSFYLLRALDRIVKAHARQLDTLVVTVERLDVNLKRVMQDIEKITEELGKLEINVADHHAWSNARSHELTNVITELKERISRVEGKVFNGERRTPW